LGPKKYQLKKNKKRNRTKKSLVTALSGAGRRWRGREGGSDLTNVQNKPIWNYHNESPSTMNIS
jgi:hypothetical protein